MSLKKYFLRSFTLIELSVALAVIGTMIGGGLGVYKMSKPQLRSDLNKIQKIEESLTIFFNTNGRLPYPAYYKDTTQSENYLKENSTNIKELNTQQQRNDKIDAKVLFGLVPTRTLGLDDDYAYDSYGKNIEYIVDSTLAEPIGTEHDKYKKSNYNPNNNGQYAVLYVNSEDEKDTQLITPNLSVSSIKNNQILTNNAGYILLSKQKQNKCYISARNNQFDENLPSDNNKLQNNCFSNDNIEKFYQGYNEEFDEMVVFSNLKEMVYKMSNANETLNGITQGDIIQYQPRIDKKLETNNKSIVGAINEINWKVRFIETFNGVIGERQQLYYLFSDKDEFYKDGESKTYKRGLYIFNEEKNDFKLVSGGGGDGVPVGTILAYSGTGEHPPLGFKWCDGASYDPMTYKELFKVIGYAYGKNTDGTFKVPNLTDKIPWQSGGLSETKTIGSEILSGLPDHRHWISGAAYDDGNMTNSRNRSQYHGLAADAGSYSTNDDMGNGRYSAWSSQVDPLVNSSHEYPYRGDRNAYGSSTIVQPPAIAMRFIIRYTEDVDEFKEYEQKVNDFTDEVKAQLAKIITDEYLKQQVCEKAYPIGSIYMSATDPRNPQEILGCGGWLRITGKTVVGYDPNDADFKTIGATGGEKKHTLTTNEMPSHNHGTYGQVPRINDAIYDMGNPTQFWDAIQNRYGHPRAYDSNGSFGGWWFDTVASSVKNSGSGQAHNNMPPYKVVYIWERTS